MADQTRHQWYRLVWGDGGNNYSQTFNPESGRGLNDGGADDERNRLIPDILGTDEVSAEENEIFENFVNPIVEVDVLITDAVVEWKRLQAPTKASEDKIATINSLNGSISALEQALVNLVAVQKQHKVDSTTLELMEGWRRVVNDEKHQYYEIGLKIAELHELERPIPSGQSWLGPWALGAGAFGQANLFVQVDREGWIVNRVVVKDCDLNTSGLEYNWKTDDLWEVVNGKRVPTEVKTMYDLRGKGGSEYIVKILNWRISEERRMYRLYIEVISIKRTDVFDQMTDFLAGNIERNPFDSWNQIVHKDLKLSNIFLSLADSNRYNHYPTPKVGDFGVSLYVKDDKTGWMYDKFTGAHDNYPIEVMRDNLAAHERPSAKTNVWGMANVVGSLMWKYEGVEGLDFQSNKVTGPSFTDEQRALYSVELQDLVRDCMALRQRDRPTFAQVLRRIRSCKNPKMVRELRYEPESSENWSAYDLKVKAGFEDRFPLAFARDKYDFDDQNGLGGETGTELAKVNPKDIPSIQVPRIDTPPLEPPAEPPAAPVAQTSGRQPVSSPARPGAAPSAAGRSGQGASQTPERRRSQSARRSLTPRQPQRQQGGRQGQQIQQGQQGQQQQQPPPANQAQAQVQALNQNQNQNQAQNQNQNQNQNQAPQQAPQAAVPASRQAQPVQQTAAATRPRRGDKRRFRDLSPDGPPRPKKKRR
ncbi:hypothetical protein Q7P37_004736 [Cladosporium fusiforme]